MYDGGLNPIKRQAIQEYYLQAAQIPQHLLEYLVAGMQYYTGGWRPTPVAIYGGYTLLPVIPLLPLRSSI